MTEKEKILGTEEAWESEELGADEKHARVAPSELAAQVDEALGLQPISIRLEKSLIDTFKLLGQFHGVGYQPLMRDALKRFAECEMKNIISGIVESQRKTAQTKQVQSKPHHETPKHKKAA